MDNPDTIQRADTGDALAPEGSGRRSLLRALGIGVGGVATALVASARPAAAQEGSTTTTSAAPAPTTAPPPKHPTDADLVLIGFAKTVELTAAAGYSLLSAERFTALGLDDGAVEVLAAITAHHRAYAEALGALYGPGSPSAPDDGIAAALGAGTFGTGDAAGVLTTAQTIEEVAADTHLELLGLAQSTNTAALLTSIQIVEARHAAVLARLQGLAYGADAPAFEDGAESLTTDFLSGEQ